MRLVVLLVAMISVAASGAAAQANLTLDEALRAAFPPPAVTERRTAFLSRQDLDAVRQAAGKDVPVDQSVVTYYVARRDGKPAGVAYFDSHRVRTEKEVLMVVVQPDGKIRGIEVLRFAEPPEYLAGDGWLAQFRGKALTNDLSLQGSIVNLAGATLTSNAITRAARRVLALHRRIDPLR